MKTIENTKPKKSENLNYIAGDQWKTKKEYVQHMNWILKTLYYLWIIVLYKKLPIQQTGHLINDTSFLQTVKGKVYSTYWHWNWWNPITYIIIIIFTIFMLFFNIILSLIQTLKITSIIKVDIEE